MSRKPARKNSNSTQRNSLRQVQRSDTLIINHVWDPLEVEFEFSTSFEVKDTLGRTLYYAYQLSDDKCVRVCNSIRPFVMKVLDPTSGKEEMCFERDFKCDNCLFPCCLQQLSVYYPTNVQIGTVNQQWSMVRPAFCIRNNDGDPVFFIRGPWCMTRCCVGVEFKILSRVGKLVGYITKKWGTVLRDGIKDADKSELHILMHLDVPNKVLLMGAAFLIDYMYYKIP